MSELLRLSVAEQLTVVSPRAKVLPEAGWHATLSEPSIRSEAVGEVSVTVAPEEVVAITFMSEDMPLMVGAVVSSTFTLKVFSTLQQR